MILPSALIGRAADLAYIRQSAADGACCSIVGVSNLGKSTLLRHLSDSSAPASTPGAFVYVDCNQMPERTARAFFIATWSALATALETRAPEMRQRVQPLYDEMADTSSIVTVALNFDEGFALALDRLPRPLVLCLDDFDEAYQHLEPQAFLNLRALKDRHGAALVYITATERELIRLTTTREQGEFYELIAPRVRFLRFWERDETRAFCQAFAARERVTFDEADLAFICDNADGHPGLVQAVCYALGAVTGAPVRDAHQDRVIHQIVQQNLATDANVQSECEKIWCDLEPDERDALLHLRQADAQTQGERGLRNKFIIRDGTEGPRVFARLFDDFVRRQKLMRQPSARGVYVDTDAGDVWVDGKLSEALTDLEYRLLLFLYGRLDRVCDKYAIVEAVWGQDYVDKVDDARIEKLISRVRQKIEPEPARPQYLLSLRGRGYKLAR
jgi:DNA-binding winged helix-turn-helix (wHTH) protein